MGSTQFGNFHVSDGAAITRVIKGHRADCNYFLTGLLSGLYVTDMQCMSTSYDCQNNAIRIDKEIEGLRLTCGYRYLLRIINRLTVHTVAVL